MYKQSALIISHFYVFGMKFKGVFCNSRYLLKTFCAIGPRFVSFKAFLFIDKLILDTLFYVLVYLG